MDDVPAPSRYKMESLGLQPTRAVELVQRYDLLIRVNCMRVNVVYTCVLLQLFRLQIILTICWSNPSVEHLHFQAVPLQNLTVVV
jgi:hypothetical protein